MPFHWGLSLILVGHLAALIVPRGFELWNGAPVRLYLLEATGLALAVWAAVGLAVLAWRRLSEPRIRAVTSPMDVVVLALIMAQIVTGIWIAVGYRWGSYWGTSVFVPYIRSLLRLQPDPALVEPLPLVLKLHVLAFFRLPGGVPLHPPGPHHHPAGPVPVPPVAEGDRRSPRPRPGADHPDPGLRGPDRRCASR